MSHTVINQHWAMPKIREPGGKAGIDLQQNKDVLSQDSNQSWAYIYRVSNQISQHIIRCMYLGNGKTYDHHSYSRPGSVP